MNALCDITEGILPDLRAFAYFLKVDQTKAVKLGTSQPVKDINSQVNQKYFFPLSYTIMQTIKNNSVFNKS